jgi:hypothetical protein
MQVKDTCPKIMRVKDITHLDYEVSAEKRAMLAVKEGGLNMVTRSPDTDVLPVS